MDEPIQPKQDTLYIDYDILMNRIKAQATHTSMDAFTNFGKYLDGGRYVYCVDDGTLYQLKHSVTPDQFLNCVRKTVIIMKMEKKRK